SSRGVHTILCSDWSSDVCSSDLTRVLLAWSRSEEGGAAFDRLKFRTPVVGETFLKFEVAQFCRTLATLLAGGTPLVAGLQTAGRSEKRRVGEEGSTGWWCCVGE